jgi:hypothetical protein
VNVSRVIAIGAVVGALDGVGIFFAPGEPYPLEILIAAILKGILVAVMVGFALRPGATWLRGAGIGAVYGLLFALVVFFAKGGLRSMDAPYVVPAGLVFGGLTGIMLAWQGWRLRDQRGQ